MGFNREHYNWIAQNENRLCCQLPQKLVHGAIIGEVDIIGCVTRKDGYEVSGHPDELRFNAEQYAGRVGFGTLIFTKWFTGPYGFLLANPVEYKEPINYKGQLRFFNVSLGAKELQGIANLPCKGIICKVTGKQFENGFDQLNKCIRCGEPTCSASNKIFQGTPTRREGM